MPFSIVDVGTADRDLFAPLTYPARRSWWTVSPDAVAIGGLWGGLFPAGLALGTGTGDGPARVLSLYVRPDYRRRGLGRALLASIEARLDAASVGVVIEYSIETCRRDEDPAKSLLKTSGWSPPEDRFEIRHASIARVVGESSWVRRARIEPPFEVFGWPALEPAERVALAREASANGGRFGRVPDPLASGESPFDPICSVGVRERLSPCDTRLVGWALARRHPGRLDAVGYAQYYVDPIYRRTRVGLAVLAEAFRRQVRAGIPDASCIIRTSNREMQNVYDRRIDFATTASFVSRGASKGGRATLEVPKHFR